MLRKWQSACVSRAIENYHYDKHFFCLATPGAGKTIMASAVAKELLKRDKIDYVICFSPSRSICEGIKEVFSRELHSPFSGRIGSTGVSLTYQSLLAGHNVLLSELANSRVLVVLDEIHHCAGSEFVQGNAWGIQLLEQVSSLATFTLSLSGTPWRTDGSPITFAKYDSATKSLSYQFEYGLKEAIQDKACRIPRVVSIDVEKINKKGAFKHQSYTSVTEFLKDHENNYIDLLLNESLIFEVLKRGVQCLSELRKTSSSAAGLVVAASYQHALMIKKVLEQKLLQDVVLVSYKDEGSVEQIEAFKNGNERWIVSIAMVSEGVDIPRLQVCCHLSDVKTELYFRQVLGRIIRMSEDKSDTCYFYTLAEEKLVTYAERLEQEVSGSYIKEFLDEISPETNHLIDNNISNLEDMFLKIDSRGELESEMEVSMYSFSDICSYNNSMEASTLSIEGIRERVIEMLIYSQPSTQHLR